MLTIENGVKSQREDVNNIDVVKRQSNILKKMIFFFNNNQKIVWNVRRILKTKTIEEKNSKHSEFSLCNKRLQSSLVVWGYLSSKLDTLRFAHSLNCWTPPPPQKKRGKKKKSVLRYVWTAPNCIHTDISGNNHSLLWATFFMVGGLCFWIQIDNPT